MGDPVYDEQKNVIGRNFGVKNIVAIMVVGFIGYSLMGEMKPISSKRKMKGGGILGVKPQWVADLTDKLKFIVLAAILGGFYSVVVWILPFLGISIYLLLIPDKARDNFWKIMYGLVIKYPWAFLVVYVFTVLAAAAKLDPN